MARGANIQNPRQPLALPAKEALCDLSSGETGLVAVVIRACARLILRLKIQKRRPIMKFHKYETIWSCSNLNQIVFSFRQLIKSFAFGTIFLITWIWEQFFKVFPMSR